MNLLFMGTSEFAVPILQSLYESKHRVVQVYTTPPANAGRGHNLRQTPVHMLAEKLNLPVSCPTSLRKPEALAHIKGLHADAIIVASYGRILPDSILSACKYGCINVHPSALPKHRGAAPIERTILDGDTTTAVCIMQMDSGIDTGDILLEQAVDVPDTIRAPVLREQLAKLGAELLLNVLEHIEDIKPQKQSEKGTTYAHKLTKEEAMVDWSTHSATHIERMTRAFDPWPGCFFKYKGEDIRILAAEVLHSHEAHGEPGLVLDKRLAVCCGGPDNGVLRPLLLQRPGRKPLSVQDFLNGFAISAGTVL
jgi:methionyl-tRNA formyltransferase